MTETYNAKLVPMELTGSFPSNSILECIKPIAGHRKGVIIIGGQWDGDDNIWWQAQRLIITNEHGTALASYPNIPDTHCIDLSDIRRWIDEGCNESVELEVTEYFSTDKVFAHTGGSPMAISPTITNNTVKMVWGEQDKAQPIAVEVEDWEKLAIDQWNYNQMPCGNKETDELGLRYWKLAFAAMDKRHHPATDWDALLFRMQNKFGRSDEYEQVFDFIKTEINGK